MAQICDSKCQYATGPQSDCDCECQGANHGALFRGETPKPVSSKTQKWFTGNDDLSDIYKAIPTGSVIYSEKRDLLVLVERRNGYVMSGPANNDRGAADIDIRFDRVRPVSDADYTFDRFRAPIAKEVK